MSFEPQNILVSDFGQLGDVVLSLPALRAIRERFPQARITVVVGKPGAEVVTLSGYANVTLGVDRVSLRDGPKLVSIARIVQLVKEVRRAKFDFVIDLHSLSETNLLGFLSGAPKRLYSLRPGRSLNYLANFDPQPPVEEDHRKRHLVDRYLDVLLPLDIIGADRRPHLRTRTEDDLTIKKLLKKEKAETGSPLIGLFPGAGHPSRRWPLEQFAALANYLIRNDGVRPIVFAGPEERALIPQIKTLFPRAVIVLDRLTIPQMASAQARLAAFVSNDTGPMHVAAAVGTPVVLLLDRRAPESYLPLGSKHRVIYNSTIPNIEVDEVYAATRSVLAAGRTESLFAS
ncbi:MAG TPA: glycosyltransferase family 9 protein [Pyrinomonadaceae bacterium]|nr:glycosyltransferase family 9 protein [Pyrinomonadaceae bacterium]